MKKPITAEKAAAIYAILVEECEARAHDADGFIHEFTHDDPTSEWRFCGSLGFGGKFRYPRMTVDCYQEDETPKRLAAIQKANQRLEAYRDPAE